MVRTKKQIVDKIAKKKEYEQSHAQALLPSSPPSPLPAEIPLQKRILPTIQVENPHIWMSVQKLQSTFTNLTLQEINEMLADCGYNEEEVILRLITRANYLSCIRQRLEKNTPLIRSIKKMPTTEPTLLPLPIPATAPMPILKPMPMIPSTDVHHLAPILLPPILAPPPPPPPTTTTTPLLVAPHKQEHDHTPASAIVLEKKPQRTTTTSRIITGRLALDDALRQVQDCQNDDRAAFEGWSDARLRAYKMIDKNPNSYYYRFNAPGEQQKKGKWSDEENSLFLSRLAELGANSQWGIFSIAIPGRVGYQCSNYYRFLIESGQLQDPNYVIDESGKARYLFDKKADDGSIEKIFRKHSKHGSMAATELTKMPKRTSKQKDKDEDQDPTFNVKKTTPYKKKKEYVSSGRLTRQRYHEELKRGQQV